MVGSGGVFVGVALGTVVGARELESKELRGQYLFLS